MSTREQPIPIDSFADRVVRARKRIFMLARKSDKPFNHPRVLDDFPSNEEIHRLLVSIFYASLEFDEMRPCRFSVQWQHPVFGNNFIAEFASPLDIESPSVLAKLAHATHGEGMIALRLIDGVLRITGIVRREGFEHDSDIELPVVFVSVSNPGVIEYKELNYRVGYSRGLIRRVRPIWTIGVIKEFLSQLEMSQYERALNSLQSPNTNEEIVDSAQKAAEKAKISGRSQLGKLLLAIQKRSHGGMVAIAGSSLNALQSRYPACVNSFQSTIDAHVSAIGISTNLLLPEGFESICVLPSSSQRVMEFLDLAGGLCGVDGCVVFDKNFGLIGFGAIVLGNSEVEPKRSIVNERGDQLNGSDLLRLRGTRHRAAVRFCDENAESLAIVISQDGDIRLFARRGQQILFVDNLTAE